MGEEGRGAVVTCSEEGQEERENRLERRLGICLPQAEVGVGSGLNLSLKETGYPGDTEG